MPVDAITEAERSRIRNDLAAHIVDYETSCEKIALYIEEALGGGISADSIKRFLDTKPKAVTVGVTRVRLLERYLELHTKPRTALPQNPALFASDKDDAKLLFRVIREFFKMRPSKADQFSDKIKGKWAFYAYSEKWKGKVCRGAISFTIDSETGNFCAEELQKAVPDGSKRPYREEYVGHFLFRKEAMIVMLTEKGESLPKFYILHIERYNNEDNQYMVMTGALLKIGAQQGVFSAKIHMIREDEAFNHCAVLPASDVPDGILKYLD